MAFLSVTMRMVTRGTRLALLLIDIICTRLLKTSVEFIAYHKPKKVGCGSFMAAKDPEREYDFVEQPPEEFFCFVSLAVLLEPYLAQCCGNHLSQEAYQRLQGQPYPVCREENFSAVSDKSVKRKVLSLKVRCPHKAEGCE